MAESVRVRVPATSANLGPGFDSFGLALDLFDEVEARLSADGELHVAVEGEGAGEVPLDAAHLTVRAMRAVFEAAGRPLPGCALRCRNRIPHGRGLGSSAAAIVAGVAAASALLDPAAADAGALELERIFAVAADLEGHPDNVAPCVYGGFTLAWRAGADGAWRALRETPSARLLPVVCVPGARLSTERARGLLPDTVAHSDAAFTAGRAALLATALTGRTELLLEATEDRLHQSYRAAAMPETAKLVDALRQRERLPAVVSGAGPSVLVLGEHPDAPGGPEPEAADDQIGSGLLDSIRRQAGTEWHIRPSRVDPMGVRVSFSRS